MTERALVYGIALLVIALALLGMATLHREHYKSRRWQMLEGRVNVLEQIIAGDHA